MSFLHVENKDPTLGSDPLVLDATDANPGPSALPESILKYARTVPEMFKGLYMRVKTEKTKAGAIKAKCQHCVGYEDTFNRILNCQTVICPLWDYRPYQERNKQ